MTSFIFEGRGLAVFLNRKKDCYLVKIAILFWPDCPKSERIRPEYGIIVVEGGGADEVHGEEG